MAASNGTVTLMTGGDIGPVYEPTEEFAALIAPVLAQADIRLGQCERVYSKRGTEPQFTYGPGGQHSRLDPKMAGVSNTAGIDIVSLASNHAMDWGQDAMLDTVDMFRGMGKTVIGAGRNDEEARTPRSMRAPISSSATMRTRSRRWRPTRARSVSTASATS